jgi:hypothetical protein
MRLIPNQPVPNSPLADIERARLDALESGTAPERLKGNMEFVINGKFMTQRMTGVQRVAAAPCAPKNVANRPSTVTLSKPDDNRIRLNWASMPSGSMVCMPKEWVRPAMNGTKAIQRNTSTVGMKWGATKP